MAEIVERESLSKPVQELAKIGNISLEKYIYKGGNGDIDASSPILEIPEIDVGLLTSSSQLGELELKKMRSALINWCGCVQLINHGMTNSFLDKIHEMSRQFFALPLDEKNKCARTVDDMEGYGNDSVLSEHQTLDWTDRLYLNVVPEDQRKLQFWPENPENFREVLEEYTNKVKSLNEVLLKAMAKSLNLDEDCFLNQYGEEGAGMLARFNFYPPCPKPDKILGVKPHADASALTFLLQDKEVEGLQILKDDQWFKVPIVPYAILVNVGDQVEIMSNGIFKSPVHRVVTNSARERNTLAVFCLPASDNEIGPAEKLIDENTPRLYKTLKSYVDIYFENYQLGKRPIDAVKI